METKKTIAILGLEKGLEKTFLDQLANDNRLLIISSNEGDCGHVSDYLTQTRPDNEAELVNCPKDGCWEADIIMIWNPEQQREAEYSKLQAVATQKIILIVIHHQRDTGESKEDAIQLPAFPNSKIVTLTINPVTKEARVAGEDQEAVKSISRLINKTGVFNTLLIQSVDLKKPMGRPER